VSDTIAPCRWRSKTANPKLIQCGSKKLVGQKFALPVSICGDCPYTDHAPVPEKSPITWAPCSYRGDRPVHPPEAPDNTRDWRRCGAPTKPLGLVVCQCCGCSPQCSSYRPGEEISAVPRPVPDTYVAPLGERYRWQGRAQSHGPSSRVTVVLCHLNTLDDLRLGVAMWRLQSLRPYIVIVDTGSPSGIHDEVEQLRDDDCEIHYVRAHGYIHSSAPVGVAMDLATQLVPSEFMFSTHTDVFPRSRQFLEFMLSRCSDRDPVVGWQMSPRDNVPVELWSACVSHTATIWHMPTMRRIGLRWDFRWWHEITGQPSIPGWPDTESPPNLSLQRAGIKPVLLGPEHNHQVDETDWYWHARSQASFMCYGGDNEITRRVLGYGDETRRRAEQLLRQWQEGK
jgi:hypothetical protein